MTSYTGRCLNLHPSMRPDSLSVSSLHLPWGRGSLGRARDLGFGIWTTGGLSPGRNCVPMGR